MSLPAAITDPIALAGYALSLVFGAAGKVRGSKHNSTAKWQMGVAYALALSCIGGGLALGFHRDEIKNEQIKKAAEAAKATAVAPPLSTVTIEGNQQTTGCGGTNAIIAGGTMAPSGNTTNCTQGETIVTGHGAPVVPAPNANSATGKKQ
jgi:hypothetical protein